MDTIFTTVKMVELNEDRIGNLERKREIKGFTTLEKAKEYMEKEMDSYGNSFKELTQYKVYCNLFSGRNRVDSYTKADRLFYKTTISSGINNSFSLSLSVEIIETSLE